MNVGEIRGFASDLECAFESQIGADEIVEALIYVTKRSVGF